MTNTFTPFSYVVINLARLVRPDEVTFSGVNSTLPMLACLLAKRAYDFHFTWLNVAGGVDANPAGAVPLSSGDPALMNQSASVFDNEDFYDLCTRGGMDLCFLGCSQIDGTGATNNSAIGDWHNPKVRLPGGGGSAVMMPTLRRAATWRTEHSTRTLVDTLFFQTAKGNLQNLITPIAVFDKQNGRLALQSHHPHVTPEQVQSVTGFELDISGASPTAPPTDAELSALQSLDPTGVFESDAAITLPEFPDA